MCFKSSLKISSLIHGLLKACCIQCYKAVILQLKINLKKAKSLSEEALQIAVKRREAKSKGEKERYTHFNVESKE